MSYKFNSIVNKNEADALKEMIFKRARERAQNYNDATQSDVMDMARESFVSKDNPFSKIIDNANTKAETLEDKTSEEKEEKKEIGFPVKELKLQQNNNINSQISSAAIIGNMREARETLSNKKSFIGALNFLNSQAAVSLMRARSDKFEIIA